MKKTADKVKEKKRNGEPGSPLFLPESLVSVVHSPLFYKNDCSYSKEVKMGYRRRETQKKRLRTQDTRGMTTTPSVFVFFFLFVTKSL